jgi:hypothetical protein
VTVNVTNAAGQSNSSCVGDPAAFTNGSGNVTVTNVINGVLPSCLMVLVPTNTPTNTPTSTPTGVPTNTPTNTPTPTATTVPPSATPTVVGGGGGPAPGTIPTLSPGMLGVLAVALATLAIVLMRRQ